MAGFVQSPPNATLLGFAASERKQRSSQRVIDVGCGAGRNAGPIAGLGLDVLGTDLSWPMLQAAQTSHQGARGRLLFALSPMDRLPVESGSIDLVVAHGIWNLARSGEEFRAAVREAARVSKPGAGLFVFTFSRNTLAPDAAPVQGETFIFTQFSGRPQCFLTEEELIFELGVCGFKPDAAVPLKEHNRPRPGALQGGGGPVIYEGAFRMTA